MTSMGDWPWELRFNLYRRAIESWGIGPQLLMVVEEMSELAKAILKLARAKDGKEAEAIMSVMEEAADVEIMLEQLRIILLRISSAERPMRADMQLDMGVDSIKAQKLERLAVRLGREA